MKLVLAFLVGSVLGGVVVYGLDTLAARRSEDREDTEAMRREIKQYADIPSSTFRVLPGKSWSTVSTNVWNDWGALDPQEAGA